MTAGLIALLVAGCTTASMPRTSAPLPYKDWLEIGAMADASRGFPVAFYAHPGGPPETIDLAAGIGTTRLHSAQWLTELARSLNIALARVTRYDDRFTPVAQQVFRHEFVNGDMVFDYREPEGGPDFGRATVARIWVEEFSMASSDDGLTAMITVGLSLTGFRKSYHCEQGGPQWDLRAFACIGERILGDSAFWTAVAQAAGPASAAPKDTGPEPDPLEGL